MKKLIFFMCSMAVFVLAFSSMAYANTIRIGLTRNFRNRDAITISTNSIQIGRGNADGSFNYNRTLTSASGFTLTVYGGQIVIREGAANGMIRFTFLNTIAEGPQIRPSSGLLNMGSESYRGTMEFRLADGRITAINVVNLEEYLYGVIPAEMSPQFHTEALRAQAVAARTYAMHRVNNSSHPGSGFHLCDTTCCQSYMGAGRENTITTQAVRDTRGIMVFAPGGITPLLTPYHSSSGGSTDNIENVWGGTLSHLRGVWDSYEQNPRIWSRTYTWAQLTSAVNAQSGAPNIGNVTGLSIASTHLGRVQELIFTGTAGQWTATRQQVLSVFGHINSSLYSRNFTFAGTTGINAYIFVTDGVTSRQVPVSSLHVINNLGQTATANSLHVFDGTTSRLVGGTQTVTTATNPAGVTINGRGWGHGVGMSQQGANSMAHAGHDFRTILRHYYTGVEIR